MKNTELSIIEKLDVNNLPELVGWKEKQETLVKENPYVEIIDAKSYDLACKSRTNLLKGRTELEKQDKAIASKVASFRKSVGGKTAELIDISSYAEEKQQKEVKRWEGIKEAEKAEKARIEDERIHRIKNEVNTFETKCLELIQNTVFANVNETKSKMDVFFNTEFNFEEYDIMFTQAKARVQSFWDSRCGEIQEKEVQRIAKEEAEAEAKKQKEQSELQSTRLAELLPFIGFGEEVDMVNLWELSQENYDSIFSFKEQAKGKYDAEQIEIKEKKEAEIKNEKDAVFKIRLNRLSEIAFLYEEENGNLVGYVSIIDSQEWMKILYGSTAVEFEDVLCKAKECVQKAEEQYNQIEKQKLDDEAKSKADAVKLKKENADRVKRLAVDKEQLTKSIGIVKDSFLSEIVFREFGNEESETLRKEFQDTFDLLFNECFTKIENL